MLDPFFTAPTNIVKAVQPIADYLHLPTLPQHAHEILISWAAYQLLDSVGAPIISSYLAPQTYKRLDARTKINWNMRVAAFAQAGLISGCAFYVLWKDHDILSAMDWKERIWAYDGGIGMVQGFATGYFLWDLSVCLIHYKLLGPETLAHAVSALVMIMLGFRPFVNYYGLNLILYEVSTPFLNIHWFLDKFGMTGSNFQLYNGVTLISTFVLSRLVWGSYNLVSMFYDVYVAMNSDTIKADYLSATNWDLAVLKQKDYDPLPLWVVSIYIGGNLILWLLNVVWLNKMVQAMTKRFTPAKVVEKKLQ